MKREEEQESLSTHQEAISSIQSSPVSIPSKIIHSIEISQQALFVSDEVRRRIVSLEKAKESFLEQQASLEKITINNFFQGVEDLLSQWLGNDYASQMTLAARSTLQEAINRRIYSLSTAICKVT